MNSFLAKVQFGLREHTAVHGGDTNRPDCIRQLVQEYANDRATSQTTPRRNALYKAKENFNCYLTPAQAIELAQNLLQKAQLILDAKLEDAAVQLWNTGEKNEKLYFGLTPARKGPRKGSKQSPPDAALGQKQRAVSTRAARRD